MEKFQRNYKMTVQVTKAGDTVTIAYPLTLEFSIKRANLSNAGSATFRLYNLNKHNRDQIYKGPTDVGIMRRIRLDAGYGDQLSKIFDGNIWEAKSGRAEGQTNYVTEIEANDYAFVMQNSQSQWTEAPGVLKNTVINRLASNLTYPVGESTTSLAIGAIEDFGTETYSRGFVAQGNTWDILKTVTNNQCYIDLGKIYILKKNSAFLAPLRIINSLTGLLGTPKRNSNWITFDMLFEPSLQVGQIINLDSQSQTKWNGQYKVIGIEHSGTISGSICGKCKTRVILMLGDNGVNSPFNMVAVK